MIRKERRRTRTKFSMTHQNYRWLCVTSFEYFVCACACHSFFIHFYDGIITCTMFGGVGGACICMLVCSIQKSIYALTNDGSE